MLVHLSESAVALVLAGITLTLWRLRAGIRPRHRGFDLLLVGLVLVTVGAVMDCFELQNLPDTRARLRESLLVVELVFGYLAGVVVAGTGIMLWAPALVRYQREVGARTEAEDVARRSSLELEARNQVLQVGNELAQRLHSTLDIETIAGETVELLVRRSQAPQVAFYVLDGDGGQLRLVAEYGFDAEQRALGARLPLQGSLSGLALGEGRLVVSEELRGDSRLEPRVQAALIRGGAHAAVVIPLLFRGGPLGSLNLIFRDPIDLGQLELEMLQAMGRTVSLAVANARHVAALEHQAFHDDLTHLPNRAALHRRLRARFAANGGGDRKVGLALLDLDRFREVNEALGHAAGDELLRQIGARLAADARRPAFRLGGDEFAVILPDFAAVEDAAALGRELLATLRQPFLVEGIALAVGASAGVAVFPDHSRDSQELLRCADVALDRAKRSTVGVVVYTPALDEHTPERLVLMGELGKAVRDGALELQFQPVLSLVSRGVVGFEALLRWRHPRLGMLHPSSFMPLAEAGDVIHPLTAWVAEKALARLQHWHTYAPALTMAINISMRNLHHPQCATTLRQIIDSTGIDPARVELELTETSLIRDAHMAVDTLAPLAATGARVAIDDFGTGYSSLAYLTRFPVHTVKIDGSFVREISRDRRSLAIVRSTLDLGRELGLAIVAEGVEEVATSDLLRRMGCVLAQGYYYGAPMPPEAVEQRLAGSGWKLADAAELPHR